MKTDLIIRTALPCEYYGIADCRITIHVDRCRKFVRGIIKFAFTAIITIAAATPTVATNISVWNRYPFIGVHSRIEMRKPG